LREIGEWALENDLWVISDEIYQNLTYDGVVARSVTELVPELADRTIMINGVAKSYAMTGWRLGWMVAPLDAAKAATNMQSHLTSNVSNISQRAALAALTGPQEPMLQMREAFDRRRKTAVRELNRIPGMVTPNPQGAFYVYPDISNYIANGVAGREIGSSLEFCDLLLEQIKVAVVPGEAFGPSGYLRMSYALGDAQLEEGIARMQQFLGSH
jgi:aspartate aminotransferase